MMEDLAISTLSTIEQAVEAALAADDPSQATTTLVQIRQLARSVRFELEGKRGDDR